MTATRTTETTDPGAGTAGPTRGLAEPLHPVVVGSVVGSVGATVFVLANRGGLPGPWPALVLAAWAVAIGVTAWVVLGRRRLLPVPPAPAPRAGLVYLGAVVGMLLVIAVGSRVLVASGHDGLRPALVALAVGLHFVPFARAFHAPVFRTLGWLVAGLGVAGLLGGLVVGTVAVAAAAVLAGLGMLVLVTADQLRTSGPRPGPGS